MKHSKESDLQPELVYKAEFDAFEEFRRSLEVKDLSKKELGEKLDHICRNHHKLLKTVVKLTKVSDNYQKKLLVAKEQAEEKTKALENAMSEIETLSGLLPICANCKQIRDEEGTWHQIENYIINHSKAEFSHSLCPVCFKTLYPKYSGNLDE